MALRLPAIIRDDARFWKVWAAAVLIVCLVLVIARLALVFTA